MNHSFKYILLFIALSNASSNATVINITDENQLNTTMSNNKNVIIEFSADWCSVCNSINKPYLDVSNEPEFSHITFAQVDVDKLDDISKKHGIVGVPTFVYVENGEKKVEEIGVQNMPGFKEHLKDNLRKNFNSNPNNTPQEVDPSMIEEEVVVDMDAPLSTPVTIEPNIFMKAFGAIKHFIMMIFMKIAEFFTTIVDAIKGFFGA